MALRPDLDRQSGLTVQDRLLVAATIENISRVSHFIRDIGQRLRLSDDALFDIDLAVEEACANIVEHAYGPGRTGDMEVRVEATAEAIRITFTDWGQSFDADAAHLVRDVPVEVRAEGGMGLLLVHETMDSVTRTPASVPGGPNLLTLVKRIER